MSERVLIIGGGIGGLSAAHHLLRAGVTDIHVYEASDWIGGKARSQFVDAQTGLRFPGEHGFRFFPHFYHHIVETMKTIPANGETVWDRLVSSEEAGVAYDGKLLRIGRPSHIGELGRFVASVVKALQTIDIEGKDAFRYAGVLLQFATSCQERRQQQYDQVSWSEFAHEKLYSGNFQDLVIKASRNLSAMRAAQSSAATIGSISLLMMFDFEPWAGKKMDPLLRGPTDEMWLKPWHAHLQVRGVQFHFGEKLTAFDFDATSALLRGVSFGTRHETADRYICAIPLEQIVPLLTPEMRAADAALDRLRVLAPKARGDMVGLQLFLRRRVPIVEGHVHYPRTPFALTSVCQSQFWQPPPAAWPVGSELADVCSAIISDWETPGTEGLKASQYTDRNKLLQEVWRQLKSSLPAGTLRDEDLILTHLDANVSLGPFHNETPLLIHPVGQLALRPDAEINIDNLYLASDYVRTYTDLATMEGADEAARRAVAALLRDVGVPSNLHPRVEPFSEGLIFDAAKQVDAALWRFGLPHPMAAAHKVRTGTADAMRKLRTPILRQPTLDALTAPPPIDWETPDPKAIDAWEDALRTV